MVRVPAFKMQPPILLVVVPLCALPPLKVNESSVRLPAALTLNRRWLTKVLFRVMPLEPVGPVMVIAEVMTKALGFVVPLGEVVKLMVAAALVVRLAAKTMVSAAGVALASMMACRSEPAPESLVFETVKVARVRPEAFHAAEKRPVAASIGPVAYSNDRSPPRRLEPVMLMLAATSVPVNSARLFTKA